MNTMSIKNTEIYILQPLSSDLLSWIENRFSVPKLVKEMNDIHIYHAVLKGSQASITITPSIEGGLFTSLFFSGTRLPWKTDADCARDAAQSILAVVRCVPDIAHNEDQWLEVSPRGERIVLWQDPV